MSADELIAEDIRHTIQITFFLTLNLTGVLYGSVPCWLSHFRQHQTLVSEVVPLPLASTFRPTYFFGTYTVVDSDHQLPNHAINLNHDFWAMKLKSVEVTHVQDSSGVSGVPHGL